MSYFLLRLIPPRATFAQDMSDAERAVMQRHVAYWSERMAAGVAIAFGPVADPAGGWGLGLVEVADAAALAELQAGDPALALGMRYEALAMPRLVHR